MPQPIQRHEALQDLSRNHHEGLLLCFKIRQGLRKEIEPERIMAYLRFFYQTHLMEHFQLEEEILFPTLGSDHPMIKRALEDHRQLTELFLVDHSDPKEAMAQIEKKLKEHIRFEERQLFNEIQDKLGEPALRALSNKLHPTKSKASDGWYDPFWL